MRSVDVGVREAGAAVPRPDELVPVPDAEHERSERPRPPSRAARVTGDHELLQLMHLDLHPVLRSLTRLVRRRRPLRHDPFQTLLSRRLEKRRAVVEDLGDPDIRLAGDHERPEPLVALDERLVEQGLAVELEKVEEIEDERSGPPLHLREARAALRVEGADLPVDHALGAAKRPRKRAGDRLEPPRRLILPGPADEARVSLVNTRDRAVAVPLDLVEPTLASRNVRGQRGQHRLVSRQIGSRTPVVALSQQQPVLLVAVHRCRHERPDALQPLAAEAKGEPPVPLLLQELVLSPIPDLDCSRPVFALRDLPLERGIGERVILHMHREPAGTAVHGQPLGNGPARERPVPLEAEIVVKTAGCVSLHDEDRLVTARRATFERLFRPSRVALSPVFRELARISRHQSEMCLLPMIPRP